MADCRRADARTIIISNNPLSKLPGQSCPELLTQEQCGFVCQPCSHAQRTLSTRLMNHHPRLHPRCTSTNGKLHTKHQRDRGAVSGCACSNRKTSHIRSENTPSHGKTDSHCRGCRYQFSRSW